MNSPKYDWDKQDHNGFYVDPDGCTSFGCCGDAAPENFRFTDYQNILSSEVYKQPSTPQELDAVFCAIDICPHDCILYGGQDPAILKRLAEQAAKDDFDIQTPMDWRRVFRLTLIIACICLGVYFF